MSWMHYNPQRADPELLDRITSGEARLALRDALLDVVRSETGRKSRQHQLLIGARGAGKTHLLRVVAHRVAEDPDLEGSWRAVVLPEEQGIRGPSELFSALVTRLAADLEKTDLAAARAAALEAKHSIGKARGEAAMRLGFDGLRRIAEALDRSIVAVVENLDALFYRGVGGGKKEANEEQWALRRCLQDADFLLLFGAAPTYFGAASDQGAAFHGFFREHTLDALPLDEVIHIARQHLELVAEEGSGNRSRRAAELLGRFESNRGRLAGMLRITGGLPRFAHLIVDLLIDSEDADSETQLERLLDEQTPYFQGRLDPRLIAPGELETLATLARASGPLRPSELARRVGISTGEVSVLLERLRERGLARRSGSYGGATSWDVAEPLYRVWMAFREGGEQRSVMVALTEVVAALYSADELRARAEEAREGRDGESVWEMAIAWSPSPEEEPVAPGREEKQFQAAREALLAAEAEGPVPAEVLIEFVNGAWRTGRRMLGASRIDEMLRAADDDPAHRADALLVAAEYGGPESVAQAAAASALFEQLGDGLSAFLARGREAGSLARYGHRREAATALAATYEHALERRMPSSLLSWLALLAARAVETRDDALAWLQRAEEHADSGSRDEANALLAMGRWAEARPERLDLLDRAADIYRSLGAHQDLGYCLAHQYEELSAAGELERAAEALAGATDTMLEHDAVLDIPVWTRLRELAVWGPRSAAVLALHHLAACVNHDELRPEAEPWLVGAATRMIAQRSPHEEMVELLETARDDLTRERRALIEPFVLAARMEIEDHAAVLFEQSEPMREVIADVRRRVDEARKDPKISRPHWAPAPAIVAEGRAPAKAKRRSKR